jgi:hypothetical protein
MLLALKSWLAYCQFPSIRPIRQTFDHAPAHFDSEDPIKFDASLKSSVHVERVNDAEDGPAVLSANLETRRKRKEVPMFQSQEWPRKKGLALGTQDRYHRMNKIQYQASI